MLTTVGRGGDGQKIRDEILNIMHRNHIPEKKGLWMEEWHQKLHNNTTPDDVPICEAYLAYLHANGNLNAYWRVLSDAGEGLLVTRFVSDNNRNAMVLGISACTPASPQRLLSCHFKYR